MKTRWSKIDLLSIILLTVLIALEFYIKREQMFSSPETILCITIGLVIGVNIGFKLASIHATRVAEKAFEMTDCCEKNCAAIKQEKKETERELEIAMQRERKLRETLETCLQERDEEVKYLVSKISDFTTEK